MNDPKVVEYVLAHMSDIWHAAVWIGGIFFIIVCAIFGVLGRVGKAFLGKLLQFQSDLLAEVKKIGGDCAETNAALRGLTAQHDALKESHDETKQELNKVWAVVTLREVIEPEVDRIKSDSEDQKKTIKKIIGTNEHHDKRITKLEQYVYQESPHVWQNGATDRQA